MTINNLTHTKSDNPSTQVKSATTVFKHIKRIHDKNIIELENTLDSIEATITRLENALDITSNRISYIDLALNNALANIQIYKDYLNGQSK